MLRLLKFVFVFTFALLQIALVPIANAKPIRQYTEIEREDLKMLLGEKLYNQPGGGCWSCHGAEGMKADGVTEGRGLRGINHRIVKIQESQKSMAVNTVLNV